MKQNIAALIRVSGRDACVLLPVSLSFVFCLFIHFVASHEELDKLNPCILLKEVSTGDSPLWGTSSLRPRPQYFFSAAWITPAALSVTNQAFEKIWKLHKVYLTGLAFSTLTKQIKLGFVFVIVIVKMNCTVIAMEGLHMSAKLPQAQSSSLTFTFLLV